MPNFYNTPGNQVVNGTTFQDNFFPFTQSANLDDVAPDAVLSQLNWTTALLLAGGSSFTITAANIQVSQDVFFGGEKSDVLYGSNLSDGIFYNNGVFGGGIGSFNSVEQFFLGGGDDVMDLSAHGTGGVDLAKDVVINAGSGNDTVIGGAGKDTIDGDAGDDLLIGWRGADTISGGIGNDTIYGDDFGFNSISGDDTLRGGSGNDSIYGGRGADRIEGGDDNDTLHGQAGGDNMFGDAGDDILYGDDAATTSNDKLDGGAGNDQLFGGNGDDELTGGGGDDLLDGGDGIDFALGGLGNDTLIASGGNDTLDGGADTDTVRFTGAHADYSIIQNIDGSFTITDLRGGSPDGTDTVRNVEFFAFSDGIVPVGGPSNSPPTITSDGGGDTANLTIPENSTAVTTVSATDPDTGQTLTYAITGGADAALFQIDPATGLLSFINAPDFETPADSDGNNVYVVIVRASDGSGGTDTQTLSITVSNEPDGAAPIITSNGGGATASIAINENSTAVTTVSATDADSPTITYSIAGGADAALFQINPQTGVLSFINAPDFEVPLDADGNNIYEVIVQASDGSLTDSQTISVTVGDVSEGGKTITGNSNNNTFSPTQTVLAFQTTALNDTIYGLGGSDTIDGGGGADTMYGGIGNDIYFVDTYSDDGVASNDDQVIELAGEGTDLVNAAVSYRLPTDVENLTLMGIAALNGTGNALANTITGNAAANVLSGEGGNDKLYGGLGNDSLLGGLGADLLDGGAGADRMEGDADNDTYVVDTYSDDGNDANDDLVVELAGGGTDTVQASVSYRLAAEVEKLTLTGTNAIDGTGNTLNNTITGNGASNILRGDAGNDTLFGNGGDDFLYGDAGNDRLEGGAGNDFLDGGANVDTLLGQAGNDILSGGGGRDTLTGGTEADTFLFALFDSPLSSSTADTITDFVTGVDKIDLPMLAGPIAASAYSEGTIATSTYADALNAANALKTAGTQVVFIAGTAGGWLFYDTNGDGSLDQSIILTGLNTLGGLGSGDLI